MECKDNMKVCSEVGGRRLALGLSPAFLLIFGKQEPLWQHNSEWCLKMIHCSSVQWRRQWKGLGETSYWFLKRFFNGFAFLPSCTTVTFPRFLFRHVLIRNTATNKPGHSSLSVTVCEPSTMSEAAVMESSSAGGLLESSCAASLDDAIVDTAK